MNRKYHYIDNEEITKLPKCEHCGQTIYNHATEEKHYGKICQDCYEGKPKQFSDVCHLEHKHLHIFTCDIGEIHEFQTDSKEDCEKHYRDMHNIDLKQAIEKHMVSVRDKIHRKNVSKNPYVSTVGLLLNADVKEEDLKG